MWDEPSIWRALRDCYHPEFALDVVELGMVLAVEIEPDEHAPGAGIPGVSPRQRVRVQMLPTEAEDAASFLLRGLVENRLLGMDGLSRVQVTLADAPPWTPARISAAGRRKLNLDGPLFPILNNRAPSKPLPGSKRGV